MSKELIEILDNPSKSVVFLTGAGISLASGIQTFRGTDPEAVWANDVLEMGTLDFFRRKPLEQWLWYLSRFGKLENAKPNPAHWAITDIQKYAAAEVNIITQNVDSLHIEARSKNVIQIHGSRKYLRCPNWQCSGSATAKLLTREETGYPEFTENPCLETLPRCPTCKQIARPHVLWFDESYYSHQDYQFVRATKLLNSADAIVFVGTSFSVGITQEAVEARYASDALAVVVEPSDREPQRFKHQLVKAKAEEWLPELARQINSTSTR